MWARHVGRSQERDVMTLRAQGCKPTLLHILLLRAQDNRAPSCSAAWFTHKHYSLMSWRVKIITTNFLFSWPNYLYANLGQSDSTASYTVTHTQRVDMLSHTVSRPRAAGKHSHSSPHKHTCRWKYTLTQGHHMHTQPAELYRASSFGLSCYHLKFRFKCPCLCCCCSLL